MGNRMFIKIIDHQVMSSLITDIFLLDLDKSLV